jgi:hypothetical protein
MRPNACNGDATFASFLSEVQLEAQGMTGKAPMTSPITTSTVSPDSIELSFPLIWPLKLHRGKGLTEFAQALSGHPLLPGLPATHAAPNKPMRLLDGRSGRRLTA